jgi:alpha-D-ribose 1-methylphosphonate 5-triphosphate diphosphatase
MPDTNSIYITNASIVVKESVIDQGALLVKDGVIDAINPVAVKNFHHIDLKGKYLLPGMIDLHCDALEKEVEPRPGVHFPLNFACAQADKRNAAAGITSVFHAISFANEELGVRNNDMAKTVVQAVNDWQPHALVDNRIHCRYEVTDPDAIEILTRLMDQGMVHLLSVMDHTPGQGQFKDISAYQDYLVQTYRKDKKEAEKIIQRKFDSAKHVMDRIKQITLHARQVPIPVASHDDDSPERIDMMHDLGIGISEFPINMDTAKRACKKGLFTVAGAPNLLRGKSQAGSMRALDGIRADAIDCLCSDYSPASLIVAVFQLAQLKEINLHDVVRLVTSHPAKACGLLDRGEIAVGKRADLIAVSQPGNLPQVTDVFVEGINVFSAKFDHE